MLRRMDKRLVIGMGALAALVLAVAVAGVWPYAQDAAAAWTAAENTAREVRWNFTPNDENQRPAENEGSRLIAEYGGHCIGPDQPVIYLTFDMGYENGHTASILDTLQKHQVPAAFFVVKHYVESEPELVQRMVAEGHLVCNHSANHKDMTKLTSLDEFQKELTDLEEAFSAVTGQPMAKFYRAPEGKVSALSLQYSQQLGYTNVLWSFAYKDWENDNQPSHEQAFGKIFPRTHNGEIALLHATSKTNAEILDEVITRWKEMGYTFGTLDQL